MYEFRVSALNAVDYGEQAVVTIQTPDGSESRHVSCAFLGFIQLQFDVYIKLNYIGCYLAIFILHRFIHSSLLYARTHIFDIKYCAYVHIYTYNLDIYSASLF